MKTEKLTFLDGRTVKNVYVSDDAFTLEIDDVNYPFVHFYHRQSCCEDVKIEDIVGGKLSELVGQKMYHCELVEQDNEDSSFVAKEDVNYITSATWSFLKLNTLKDSITVRWWGESNGYYSETISIYGFKTLDEIGNFYGDFTCYYY
jgi:hypothetical protein